MNRLQRISLTFLAVLIFYVCQAQSLSVPLRYDRYYTYDEIVEPIKTINSAYPELTNTVLVGYSDENREIWALERGF